MMVVQDLAKASDNLKFKMAAMPIYGKKTIRQLLLQNHWADLADILLEAFGGTSLYKIAKIGPDGS